MGRLCASCGKRKRVAKHSFCSKVGGKCERLLDAERRKADLQRAQETRPNARAPPDTARCYPTRQKTKEQAPDHSNDRDGMIMVMSVNESLLPKFVPVLAPHNVGVRAVLRNKDGSNGRALANFVKEAVMKWEGVKRVAMSSFVFVSNLPRSQQGTAGRILGRDGLIHRDGLGNNKEIFEITVLVPMDTYVTEETAKVPAKPTGGIKIWRESHRHCPDRTFGGSRGDGKEPVKNLNQVLDRKFGVPFEWHPVKGEALLFDSRLLHQSLLHRAESCRHCFGFRLRINAYEPHKLSNNTESAIGWKKREQA